MADGRKITIAELRRLLRYESETGEIFWRDRNSAAFATLGQRGYLCGKVRGYRYLAHRVAWALHHGSWPKHQIDHINGKRDDNRIINLRDVVAAENQRNMARSVRNRSGVVGVCFDQRTASWAAYISRCGKQVQIGRFRNFDAAVRARKQEERNNGYHPNHGRAVV